MKIKQPEVTLVTHTEDPIGAIALAVSAWASESIESERTEEEKIKLAKKGIKAFHRTALEYVDMVFIIKNCSRSFQQQLTRTRLASFSIQSMRMVTKSRFATDGHYTMPPGLSEIDQILFHTKMLKIQHDYVELLKKGWSTENARSILPSCIHSDITMKINLNSLYHMLNQRLCVNTQWEYRQVALQIKQQIAEKMGIMLSGPISAPCVKANKCPMKDEYCGIPVWQLPEEEQLSIYKTFVSWEKINNKHHIVWEGEYDEE